MSILAGLLERRFNDQAIVEALSSRRTISTWAGQTVTTATAMRNIAVWASTNFISEIISTLPIHTYVGEGAAKRPVEDPPIVSDPSPNIVSSVGWKRQIIMSWLLRGNSVGVVSARDAAMRPSAIDILNPDDLTATRKGKLGTLEWKVGGEVLNPADVWHLSAYEVPGSPIGLSPISHVAQTVGLGLAAQQFGAQWFADGGHPSAMLTNEKAFKDETGAKRVKEKFLDATRGNREPFVAADGWKYEAISVSAEESQFLDTINANGAQIATFFGLRPEDIGYSSGDSQTYANIEQRQIARLVYPIYGWIRRLEIPISALLAPNQYVKFNIDALVRVDLATRYRAHDLSIRAGFSSRNERRALEEMAPIEGGDEFLWPPYRAFPLESDSEGDQ